ncbi:MAG TPA: hypothetical protein VF381_05230 [Thermoanaerobaculia bacterium]
MAVAETRDRLNAWLTRRFSLRLHMTLILVATFAVGLLTVHGLFVIHVAKLWMRYAIAVIVAYAVFLGLLKVWLIYFAICIRHAHGTGSSGGVDFDFCDLSSGGSSSGSSSSISDLSSGGGKFGGGGASGSWGTPESQPVITAPVSSHGSSSGSGFGGLDLDGDEIVLVLIIIAVATAIIGAGVYLIWAAPTILSDTAFNAVLASALVHKTKKVSHPEWVGSVLHATAIPFSIVLALTILMGWYAQHICPTALRVRDAIHCASRR